MNSILSFVLILLIGYHLSEAYVPCSNGQVYDYSALQCINNVINLGAECDTLNDQCPYGTFCSPRFLRCMRAMSEGQSCSSVLPINEVVLCNKQQHLYCLGGICRKIIDQNIVQNKCGMSCGDPAHFFCNPYSGNCEEYRVAGQACNQNVDFCKKSQGFSCAADYECRIKY